MRLRQVVFNYGESTHYTVGVIGGGQLARMMTNPANELGINLRILIEEVGVSADLVNRDTIRGDISLESLRRIAYGLDKTSLQAADVLTFEHEFVPNAVIQQIESEGFAVQPSSCALIHAQNKIVMRKKMQELGLPNPKYCTFSKVSELLQFAKDNELSELVIKTPTGGYDGKGVYFIKINSNYTEIDAENLAKITALLEEFDALLAEEKLSFSNELSVIVARNELEAIAYETSLTIQEEGVCRTTITPAPNLSLEIANSAKEIALKIAEALQMQGILAVEMFLVDNKLFINELAMRPHNTGHWTIDGAVTCQFENHLRGVLNLPLGSASMHHDGKYIVMQNILGSTRHALAEALPAVMGLNPNLKVNLYDKGIRKGRKLGHISIVGDDWTELMKIAKHASDLFEGKR